MENLRAIFVFFGAKKDAGVWGGGGWSKFAQQSAGGICVCYFLRVIDVWILGSGCLLGKHAHDQNAPSVLLTRYI